MVVTEPRELLSLRVPAPMKRQITDYAQCAGISVNAAASLLLAVGLGLDLHQRAGRTAGPVPDPGPVSTPP